MNQRRMVKIMSRNAEERLRYHNVMESSCFTIPLFRHHLSIAMREEPNQHIVPTMRTPSIRNCTLPSAHINHATSKYKRASRDDIILGFRLNSRALSYACKTTI